MQALGWPDTHVHWQSWDYSGIDRGIEPAFLNLSVLEDCMYGCALKAVHFSVGSCAEQACLGVPQCGAMPQCTARATDPSQRGPGCNDCGGVEARHVGRLIQRRHGLQQLRAQGIEAEEAAELARARLDLQVAAASVLRHNPLHRPPHVSATRNRKADAQHGMPFATVLLC